MFWANLLHIYQPPRQKGEIVRKVAQQSYFPIFSILEKNPKVKITLNIPASLTEQLDKFGFQNLIKKINWLAKRGQVEFTSSAAYHAFLPLLPRQEIQRQINLNENINKKYFGENWQPKGFFPPEMAYNLKVGEIVKKMGYQWIVLDEIAYKGEIGEVNFDSGYQLKNSKLKIIFRNRPVSDLFFTGAINSAGQLFSFIKINSFSKNILITAMDGENLGHHRRGMDILWEKAINSPKVTTRTYSELLDKYQNFEKIFPLSCSWSSREGEIKSHIPFALWKNPKNEIHLALWKMVYEIIKIVTKNKKDRNYTKVRMELDKLLNSDPFWWVSATPWWYPDFTRNYTDQIVKTTLFLSLKLEEKAKLQKMKDKIDNLRNEWIDIQKAEKIRRAYLKGEDKERYFGGKIVK